MQEILSKTHLNFPKLKSITVHHAGEDLSGLSEPCYYPKTKMPYHDYLNALGLTERDIKDFIKRAYKGTKAEAFNVVNEPFTNLLLIIMHIFSTHRDKSAFKYAMIYFCIVHYSRLMNKMMQYCDPDAFRYAMDNLTKTHLFAREKTISGAMYFLANEFERKYYDDIQKWDVERIIAFIQECRTRISQSIKSFADAYYNAKETGSAIKTQTDFSDDEANSYQYQNNDRGKAKIEEVIKKLTVYKVIDKKALEDAKNLSKVKGIIADTIVKELTDVSHMEKVRTALYMFLKGVTNSSELCGSNFLPYVRKLMAVKRTVAQMYFKGVIESLLVDILKNTSLYPQYQSYTNQTQFIINTFLAYYLTMYVRHSTCVS
jgi:hypothetical protein